MNITRKRTKQPTEAQQEKIRSMVGKMSDARVAELVGVSFSHVRRIRLETGVSPCYCAEKRLERYKSIMGRYPDTEIAKLAGVSRQRIHQYREKYEIPAPPSGSEIIRGLIESELIDK